MPNCRLARERMVETHIGRLPASFGGAPSCVVAIPMRNEAERIAACLRALSRQRTLAGQPLPAGSIGLVLLANNCTDDTVRLAKAALAESALRGTELPALIVETRLAPPLANVGFARGVALELGARWLERRSPDSGVLLTTDADSRVPPDWVARSLAAIEAGCGAVAGRVRLEPREMRLLSPALKQRGRLESGYEAALLRLQALIDPLPHDPWPNHWTASGASYALSLAAYRAIGGLPMVASSEDRALAETLHRHDIAIRHDPALIVTTSARLTGRAPGGVAEALRRRAQEPDLPGDDRLEALPHALHRFLWRARLRHWHRLGTLGRPEGSRPHWSLPLGLSPCVADEVEPCFGAFWQRIEALSPQLVRQALPPSAMLEHARAARRMLRAFDQAALTPEPGNRADTRPRDSGERPARFAAVSAHA
ncbi:glycosyltransferase [Ancylobacter sp. A5.8]|uniref:glycosyltransferase n=1 Tax=Ancylobacter gelatini TaxID=2919920 RepID=UPI001F4ECEA3|nr:glycosyltransferase [Ancylobacter gelatini]MCJ8142242.1 glycosyltransferase [Ancylobacter gelatini]